MYRYGISELRFAFCRVRSLTAGFDSAYASHDIDHLTCQERFVIDEIEVKLKTSTFMVRAKSLVTCNFITP